MICVRLTLKTLTWASGQVLMSNPEYTKFLHGIELLLPRPQPRPRPLSLPLPLPLSLSLVMTITITILTGAKMILYSI